MSYTLSGVVSFTKGEIYREVSFLVGVEGDGWQGVRTGETSSWVRLEMEATRCLGTIIPMATSVWVMLP